MWIAALIIGIGIGLMIRVGMPKKQPPPWEYELSPQPATAPSPNPMPSILEAIRSRHQLLRDHMDMMLQYYRRIYTIGFTQLALYNNVCFVLLYIGVWVLLYAAGPRLSLNLLTAAYVSYGISIIMFVVFTFGAMFYSNREMLDLTKLIGSSDSMEEFYKHEFVYGADRFARARLYLKLWRVVMGSALALALLSAGCVVYTYLKLLLS